MRFITKRRGISFVEVMVTTVILASGLTGVFQAYLKSLQHLDYLSTRLYMHFLLDQKISELQKEFATTGKISGDHSVVETLEINKKMRLVEFSLKSGDVDDMENLLHIILGVRWADQNRRVNVSRHAYLRK